MKRLRFRTAGSNDHEGLWLGMAALLSRWENKGKNMKHTSFKLIRVLYSGPCHSLSNQHKLFSLSLPQAAAVDPDRNGRHSRGRPCREKRAGYSGLGKVRTGNYRVRLSKDPVLQSWGLQRARWRMQVKAHKTSSSVINPKYLKRQRAMYQARCLKSWVRITNRARLKWELLWCWKFSKTKYLFRRIANQKTLGGKQSVQRMGSWELSILV